MRHLLIGSLLVMTAAFASASGAPETAFTIAESDYLYDRDEELRWAHRDSTLTVHTTSEIEWTVEVVSDDVLKLSWSGGTRYLFRVGSPAYKRMASFRECVNKNRGKPLFEVKDCGNPLPSG